MAERSGPSRILACILVGLGTFLLAVAVLIPTYTVDKLKKTPLDLEVTTVATGNGDVLESKALLAGKAEVNTNVPIVAQRYVITEQPSDADVISLQAGQTLIRTDKQGESGLLTATVDRLTADRVSSMPVEPPVGTIQTSSTEPAEEVSHTGLQYKWPFDAEKKSYPYFDLNSRTTQDINFVEETEINGMKVYHYNQVIEPVDLSKVVRRRPPKQADAARQDVGRARRRPAVTMIRWYANERDVWVDPITGVVIKGQEKLYQYYARDQGQARGDGPEGDPPVRREHHRVPDRPGQGRPGQAVAVRAHPADRRRNPRRHRADRRHLPRPARRPRQQGRDRRWPGKPARRIRRQRLDHRQDRGIPHGQHGQGRLHRTARQQ